MKRSMLLLALATLTAGSPAAAETEEEAVAYTFLGLADGASLERSGTTMDWIETGSSPAIFDGEVVIGGHKSRIRITVTTVETCRYEITLQGPPNLVPGTNRLFGRVALREIDDIGISEDGRKSTFNGIGFCETGQRNVNCMTVHSVDLFGTVEPERHRKTVEHLATEICPPAMN